jgi:hypothetical protein
LPWIADESVAKLRAATEIAVLYFIVENIMCGYGGSLIWVGINKIRIERGRSEWKASWAND